MYAISRQLIVSLWKVDDQATSLLMQELYKQILQQDKSPVVALREAQLNLWQRLLGEVEIIVGNMAVPLPV